MSSRVINLTQALILRGKDRLDLKPRKYWSVLEIRRAMVISHVCWVGLFLFLGFLVYQAACMVHRNEVRYQSILLAHEKRQRTVEERAAALTAEILRLRQLNQHTATHLIDLASNLQSIMQTAHGAQVDFLEWIVPEALRIQISHGVPASATVAMAIYESNYGRSVLATEHHNYFGIKALSEKWRGDKTLQTTRDRGRLNQAWFRRYPDRNSAVNGFAEFLQSSSLYQSAFNHRNGGRFVQAVLAAGYCPDKDYLPSIQMIIQRHLLHKLDLAAQTVVKADPSLLSAASR